MSAMDRPTTDGSGILKPAASSAEGVPPRPEVTFPVLLSFVAIETSFASAAPAATQAAG